MKNLMANEKMTLSIADQLGELRTQIRAKPEVVDLRIHLFQLLCVIGDWDRAATQLEVCSQLDSRTHAMAGMYRQVLRCEAERTAVFACASAPQTIGAPPEWLSKLIEVQQCATIADTVVTSALRKQALELAPAISGSMDGHPFEWICDADSRFGPIIEAFIDGQYRWVALSDLCTIELDPPQDLRDLIWLPATLTFHDHKKAMAFIPTRYPGSEQCEDAVKLARSTRWENIGDDAYAGIGQRMFATDVDEYALLDVRRIDFDRTPS